MGDPRRRCVATRRCHRGRDGPRRRAPAKIDRAREAAFVAANVADAFGSSLGRALAPYAAGLAIMAVALAALRELFAPVEKVARQALSLALLVAVVAFCVDHWDAVYGSFQVVRNGEQRRKSQRRHDLPMRV